MKLLRDVILCRLLCLALSLAPTVLSGSDDETFFIREIRVIGARSVAPADVQRVVYPYLGPERSFGDIENARLAVEDLYQSRGLQTVSVEIPPQQVRRGVVALLVREVEVGQLRVRGSRYFDIHAIKSAAPSMQEGKVPDFNEVMRDLIALNQIPERRITPELRPGKRPDTVDIDLVVEDDLPLHGSVELNNRYSAGTSELRLNAAIRYDNFLQGGHSFGLSTQLAPEEPDEVFVLSAFLNWRFRSAGNWRLLLQATKQDTNIGSLGGITVAGRGDTLGFRIIYTPPLTGSIFQSVSFGMDYRRHRQNVDFGEDDSLNTPITYFPVSVMYTLVVPRERSLSEVNVGLNLHFRGLGSEEEVWSNNRFRADGGYVTVRADWSETLRVHEKIHLFARIEGQLASDPLISQQQFAAGGLNTVRGYLEGEIVGDRGVVGTLEARLPRLYQFSSNAAHTLSLYGFMDVGHLALNKPLPEQTASFKLGSLGFGTRFQINDHLSGSIDFAVPVWRQLNTRSGTPRITFSLRGEL